MQPLEIDHGGTPWTVLGTLLTAAGWGKTENGVPSSVLLQTDVAVDDVATCRAAYGTLFAESRLGRSAVCAGREEDGKAVLVGITTYGEGCAAPGYPGVYTKLSSPSIQAFHADTFRPTLPIPMLGDLEKSLQQ